MILGLAQHLRVRPAHERRIGTDNQRLQFMLDEGSQGIGCARDAAKAYLPAAGHLFVGMNEHLHRTGTWQAL